MWHDKKPTVFIVDDDPSVVNSLSLLLGSVGYFTRNFSSAEDFLDEQRDHSEPSCLVLDVNMPGLSGLALQKRLTDLAEDIPIIFISGHGDIPMSVEAMKMGAVDFLPKPFDDHALLDAIQASLLKSARTREEAGELSMLKQRCASLSPREHEVLTYVLTGMLNKQIAYELKISERTVKAHRKQVLLKMGVRSVAELVRQTEKLGIEPAHTSP